jgi:hypothetical protein
VDYFDNRDALMWRQERYYPVSFSVEKESEAKFWDGGQCEVVGEGTYDEEHQEGEGGQEWGLVTSGSNSPQAADDHDLQLAMALSEEDPQMGDELARRLSHFNSIPVSTCNSRFLLEISEVPLSLFICGSSLRLFARNL